jgi:hypothetical protein
MTRWQLCGAVLTVVMLAARPVAAQDPATYTASSTNGGATWYTSDGGVYDGPTMGSILEWVCSGFQAAGSIFWAVGYAGNFPVAGNYIVAGCSVAWLTSVIQNAYLSYQSYLQWAAVQYYGDPNAYWLMWSWLGGY